MISPYKIKYNNVSSNELGLMDLIVDVALESDNGETQTFLNRTAVQFESYDGRYKNTVRYKYDELFEPKFTFMKKNFADFTSDEVRRVLKWLTSVDSTALLEVYSDESNAISWASIGGWTDIQSYKIANGRTIAITAVFSSIMPFALSDLRVVTKNMASSAENKVTIIVDNDDNHAILPRLTIQKQGLLVNIPAGTILNIFSDMVPNTVYFNGATYYWKSDEPTLCTNTKKPNYDWEDVVVTTLYSSTDVIENGKIYYYVAEQKYRWIDPYLLKESTTNPQLPTTSVRIQNRHTDALGNSRLLNRIVVQNNIVGERVVLDGANKVVYSSRERRIFGDDFNLQWLELYDGTNEITVEGNCEIKLEWREIRKVGSY